MTTGLKWFIALVVLVFIAIGVLFYAVRYHDGPMEIISGGPFTSGELIEDVEDWSFLAAHQTIEMQTMVPPRSRTMWLVVVENRPFVLSSYMNTRLGKIWKQWPRTIEQDDRAIIRVEGKLYEMELDRITEGEIVDEVLQRFNEKYQMDYSQSDIDEGNSWLFELEPA